MTPTPDEIARKIVDEILADYVKNGSTNPGVQMEIIAPIVESYAAQKNRELGERIDKLGKFIVKMLSNLPDGDVDGGDLQDTAVECGLLVPTNVTEPCGEICYCAEYDDFPQTCYRLSPELQECKYALTKSEEGRG